MRASKVLSKIRAGKRAKIAMMGHFMPMFIAYAAEYGFDGIWLDLEHRAMDSREVQALLAFFHLYDIDCILRPATQEKASLYRYLEDGATGLMIPHVNDAATVADLVSKVKFPPLGDRGLEGRGLEANFGLDTAISKDAFVDYATKQTFLSVQIETPQSVENLPEIAAVDGLDMLFVGPSDLSLRMNLLPEDQRLALEETLRRVNTVSREHNLAWGCLARTPDQLKQFADMGANFLLWGIDAWMVQDGLKQAAKELKDL